MCQLDKDHFGSVAAQLTLYFGIDDGWVNDSDTDALIRDFPSADIIRCTEGHGHAFVLTRESSERVGSKVAGWCRAAVTRIREAEQGHEATSSTCVNDAPP